MYLFAISTGMRETGIRHDIAERIIGHPVESGIVGGYRSYNWLPVMKAALQTVGGVDWCR